MLQAVEIYSICSDPISGLDIYIYITLQKICLHCPATKSFTRTLVHNLQAVDTACSSAGVKYPPGRTPKYIILDSQLIDQTNRAENDNHRSKNRPLSPKNIEPKHAKITSLVKKKCSTVWVNPNNSYLLYLISK